ncbi:hypothetical protein BCR43DRAFT_519486 [Syncephalastrum racemosum]|uniref:Uncharacterized protein n=1 Tax=Syncephalastrum racemosum TaxID=13706 RepID=A0A1X2GYU2_SYNRA|nr:hypothetical protein BCR43DRAFT_519486 [Syncephalastrum racemosum]
MSRATSTWTAGLASSVLSAAHRRHPEDVDLAVSQARAITSAVRAEVDTANVLRSIALHMARIALHSVATSSVYTLEAKRHIYKNFFQSTRCARASKKLSAQVWEGFAAAGQSDSSVSCGQKTWTWIISMATSYEDTRSANLNDLPRGLYSAAAPALDRAAIIANPNNLIAYPQDAAIRSLAGMMSPNAPLRNILLSARHTWWQGYHGHWEDAPKVPSSVSRRPLIETLSRELDSAFRSNIMHNLCHAQAILRVDEKVQKLGARSRARREILNFVNHQRTVLETSCGVRIVARSQKGKAKAVADEMDIYDALGIKRPAANEPSSASQARTKRTKPIDAHHLLALTLFMINTAPSSSSLSFPVTPTTKPKDVSILFSDTCFDVMIRHIGKFCNDNDSADSVLQDYLAYCQGTGKKSPIQFALDISTMASERRGAITCESVPTTGSYGKLSETQINLPSLLGRPSGRWCQTDGAFINWLKPASEDQWRKHPRDRVFHPRQRR